MMDRKARLFQIALKEIEPPVDLTVAADGEAAIGLLEWLKRGESVTAFRAVRIHKDGRHVMVSLTVRSLRNSEGQVIGGATQAREIH
jgi:hypothetical protein